jgi:hypothetical protein
VQITGAIAMILLLTRLIYSDKCTIGELYVDGRFECYTLEDRIRSVKVPKETAIPTGRYRIEVTYSNKFKQQMPLLINVHNFSGVRIHSGNTAKDRWGCILARGYEAGLVSGQEGSSRFDGQSD